jgi:hypothetical protein
MDRMNENPGLDFETAGGSESEHTDDDEISITKDEARLNSTPEFKRIHRRKAAERFVELLSGDLGNPLCWRLIHDSNKRAEAFKHDHTLDYLMDTFLKRQGDGYGVFAVVNGGGHRDAHIDNVRAVFSRQGPRENDQASTAQIGRYSFAPHAGHYRSIRSRNPVGL